MVSLLPFLFLLLKYHCIFSPFPIISHFCDYFHSCCFSSLPWTIKKCGHTLLYFLCLVWVYILNKNLSCKTRYRHKFCAFSEAHSVQVLLSFWLSLVDIFLVLVWRIFNLFLYSSLIYSFFLTKSWCCADTWDVSVLKVNNKLNKP